ncbi:MAG TPA: hypothetical protein VKY33_07930 [Flavobacterium sp.]|nr:hypothetical protein [Flavobacterium sp.]
MNLYYRIWVDAIVKIRSNPLRNEDWKWLIQALMAAAMGVKLMFFIAIFERYVLEVEFYNIGFNFPILDSFIKGALLFFVPPFLLNYLLIFRKDKYELLLKRYSSHNGKLFLAYFFASILLPLSILITAFFLR